MARYDADNLQTALEAWLMIDRRARMLVDRECSLLWSNRRARQLLEEASIFRNRGGRVTFADAGRAEEFQSFVGNADGKGSVFCAYNCEAGRPIVVHARELEIVQWQQTLGLSIHLPGEPLQSDFADYGEFFGLTPAEHRIVALILSGQTAEQIATHNGGSVGTVRTHIRNIYAKLDVSSREGLFSKILPFRL